MFLFIVIDSTNRNTNVYFQAEGRDCIFILEELQHDNGICGYFKEMQALHLFLERAPHGLCFYMAFLEKDKIERWLSFVLNACRALPDRTTYGKQLKDERKSITDNC